MLPDVLPRTSSPPSAKEATQRLPEYVPAEHEPGPVTTRRRAERPATRQRPLAERRGKSAVGARSALRDDTPLQRVRRAMSQHQVDAILVLDRDDGAPLRWVTRDGVIRKAERGRSDDKTGQAIADVVAHLKAHASFAQLRELVREPDVARVLIWSNSGPLAIVSADELFAQTTTGLGGPAGDASRRPAPQPAIKGAPPAIAGHARRLLGLVARAQPDVDGWTSEAQLESMVAGGRLEWRVQALEALTAAGLLERVQRDGQFDYRLTPRGLELADAHRAPVAVEAPQTDLQSQAHA
jgi:CBS domain-containing protein